MPNVCAILLARQQRFFEAIAVVADEPARDRGGISLSAGGRGEFSREFGIVTSAFSAMRAERSSMPSTMNRTTVQDAANLGQELAWPILARKLARLNYATHIVENSAAWPILGPLLAHSWPAKMQQSSSGPSRAEFSLERNH
jgi:hypothetical protein